ncbi:ABC transporter ATP-binding protein [Massilia sp. Root418]|jgi:ABC-2 type transport system ATP-binding protein|uniref:ABC transporter ATP-binding protein n=1 Tax=Massilia sp. Root418 TaxID=1736532 RepID=UPI0006FC62AC|nr:ATP-binding cassette domain-containing protein [Massilia sp. Root418]KQW89820.1 ABC transporter ATP-binding protein [Massilia sp. Root418]
MLHIDCLDFEYAARPLFRQFSLQLGAGITWLRGENGAGKTTLLKLVAGALQPHAGTIALVPAGGGSGGIDSAAQPLAYRLQSYYCGGDTPQLPWLTVREVLDLHVALYPATDAALLDAELRAFRLAGALDQPVTTLSLGQHKKMQLSLALALPVSLLLIDEPFNGLDAAAVDYLRARLADPARRARQCIVLTSHLEPALPLAQTVQL